MHSLNMGKLIDVRWTTKLILLVIINPSILFYPLKIVLLSNNVAVLIFMFPGLIIFIM